MRHSRTAVFGFLLLWGATPAMAQTYTRIVTINQSTALAHEAQLAVQPGDTLSFYVDDIGEDAQGAYQLGQDPQNYLWYTDQGNQCDAARDCSYSGFTKNLYGVDFTVPYNIGKQILLTVRNKATGTSDQVLLINSQPQWNYTANVYTNSYDYQDSYYDHTRALANLGYWVSINGERCFVPTGYRDRSNWQPYQNGRWVWTKHGWTWDSYDPWGWVTDHYGYWRHHRDHGWVWFALPGARWYPALVSFYASGDYFGWNPYWNGYSRGYQRGVNDGFDDGFEHGYRAGYNQGYNAGYNQGAADGYNRGLTFVPASQFLAVNVYKVQVAPAIAASNYHAATAVQGFNGQLISAQYRSSKEFVEARGLRVVEASTTITQLKAVDGNAVQMVRLSDASRQLPAEQAAFTQQLQNRLREGKAPVELGARLYSNGTIEARPQTQQIKIERPNIRESIRNDQEWRPFPKATGTDLSNRQVFPAQPQQGAVDAPRRDVQQPSATDLGRRQQQDVREIPRTVDQGQQQNTFRPAAPVQQNNGWNNTMPNRLENRGSTFQQTPPAGNNWNQGARIENRTLPTAPAPAQQNWNTVPRNDNRMFQQAPVAPPAPQNWNTGSRMENRGSTFQQIQPRSEFRAAPAIPQAPTARSLAPAPAPAQIAPAPGGQRMLPPAGGMNMRRR